MGYLVSKGINGVMSYKGTPYVNPDKGTHRLCLRTGTGAGDIVKYGLTTNSSASQYCGMKMRIDGKVAYIGMSSSVGAGNCFTSSMLEEGGNELNYTTVSRTYKYGATAKSSSSNTGTMKSGSSGSLSSTVSGSTVFESSSSYVSGSSTYRATRYNSNQSWYTSYSTISKSSRGMTFFAKDNPNAVASAESVISSKTTYFTATSTKNTTRSSNRTSIVSGSATSYANSTFHFSSVSDDERGYITYSYSRVLVSSSYRSTWASRYNSESSWISQTSQTGMYSVTFEKAGDEMVADNINL